jgi:hypothetical protein
MLLDTKRGSGVAEKKSWMDSISETVEKATKAASEAWEGTADARKDAWEKTRAALDSASEAIDQGVEKARGSFKADDGASAETSDAEASPEGTEDAAESDDLEVIDVVEELEDPGEEDTT